MNYPFSEIEPYWQQQWRANKTYHVSEDHSLPKYYVLDMFPYPSGTGLHVGHPEGYTATDIVSRYKRMSGFNVLHPMGFDAFGLPTERQAMVENVHPAIITERNIATFTTQLNRIGFDFDWDRMVNTTDPEYVKWTQWMFLEIYNSYYDHKQKKARPISELPIPETITSEREIAEYQDKHRLAYIANIPVNWCEALGTVLANEEVDEWVEKGYTVERRPMRQWMMRITAYAQRLLDDLDGLDWPTSTLEMQRNWIGRSEGAEIHFRVADHDATIVAFTTRPDTIFGATYMVLAPEHPLVDKITIDEQHITVTEYRNAAAQKSDLERTELAKVKTGVYTGAYAINPASGEKIPIWVADYVLAHYGTGAIMAVPGHDQRDYDFAVSHNIPIVTVVEPIDKQAVPHGKAFVEHGVAVASNGNGLSLNGLTTEQAITTTSSWLEAMGLGKARIQFKLRDWLFSRQRYWGEPIPIIYFDNGTKRGLDVDELPLTLPDVDDFNPAGIVESALSTVKEWVDFTDKKTGKHARLETNTMPQWAGSCWYFLRYCDPHNNDRFCSTDREQYWMGDGVDLYVGGSEHAVLHLMYARFWHKVLFDLGHVSCKEPVQRLYHQGLILGSNGKKMSKSLGNVVNPDDVIDSVGADSLRLYEMFLGPLEASKPWSESGIEGVARFLDRVWRLCINEDGNVHEAITNAAPSADDERVLHQTIKKTREDIEALSMNTAIAQFMIFVNHFTSLDSRPKIIIEQFLQCLAPFAPHITEELWHRLGNTTSIHRSTFPEFDEAKLIAQEQEIVFQVNSKIRGKATMAVGATEDELIAMAQSDEGVQRHLDGKTVRKTIVVRGKLVNFIAN